MARVLVACEFSGRVREAFREAGHDTYSCDILPAEDYSPFHFQEDIALLLQREPCWDLMIAHPPCTYLANSGARWWPQRQREQAEALSFVFFLLEQKAIERIAIENPVGKIGTAIRPADQYIQPWEFGHLESKKTGLWLKNLPCLVPTNIVEYAMLQLPLKQRTRIHYMPPGPQRAKERSRTYQGIAKAMAWQWGPIL